MTKIHKISEQDMIADLLSENASLRGENDALQCEITVIEYTRKQELKSAFLAGFLAGEREAFETASKIINDELLDETVNKYYDEWVR